MKKKRERRVTMLLAIMMLIMNLIVSPVWAEPGVVAINALTFPDPNFREYVKTTTTINTNGDDALSQDELNRVTEINVQNKGITDLKGVEYFTKLKTLKCSQNKLTALDLKNNTNLETLFCDYNQLTNLDLSQNTKLIRISCAHNQLVVLDLTKNTDVIVFNGICQKRLVTVKEGSMSLDLKTLATDFVPSKMSDLAGGTVSGNTLTLDSTKPSTVTYKYDTGHGILDVKLNVKYNIEAFTVTFDKNGGSGDMADVTKNAGETYTLPACGFTAPAGKEFKDWEVGGVEKAVGDSITVNSNITVKATWKEKPPVTYTLNASVDGGHGSVNPTNETKNAGDTVTLTFAPETGYEIEEVKVNDVVTPVSGNTLTLTMDGNKTVVVKYKKTPTPPPIPTVDSIAVNSTDHKTEYKVGEALDVTNLTILVTMSDTTTKTVPVTADMVGDFDTSTAGTKTLTITYQGKKTTYNITVTPVTCTLRAGVIGGHGTVSPELATVEKGKSVKVTFTSEDGYKVDTITINDEPTGVTGVSFSWTITMDEDKTVEVKFKPLDTPSTPTQYKLTATVEGGHGTVTPESATVDKDKFLEVTFNPETNYEIDTVILDGEDVKSQVTSNKLLVSMHKNRTLTVKFKPTGTTPPPTTQYTLTASVNGGHGSVDPTTKTVDKDETVTLTFAPDPGYELDTVTVNGTVVGVMSNVLDIIMNENKTVVVKFKATGTPPIGTPVTITFDKNGGTGTMADVTKTKGESFTLPACGFTAPAGKEFKAWKVDGTEKNVGDNIVLNGDKIIKAVWKDIGSVPPTPPVPPTPYTPYPWIVYPGWYYNFEAPKPKEEKPAIKMEMDWKLELIVGVSTINREINGVDSKIKMDVAPYIRDSRIMLPIRYVAEALGFDVEWNRSTRTVVLKNNSTRVEIPVDTNKIIVNGTVYTSDVKPEIKNNRTMLPIANIARALGLRDGKDIIWNSKSKMVTIYRSIVVK